jgi:hypothetical protein
MSTGSRSLRLADQLVREPYAWPGGYPMYAVTDDGGVIAVWRAILRAELTRDAGAWMRRIGRELASHQDRGCPAESGRRPHAVVAMHVPGANCRRHCRLGSVPELWHCLAGGIGTYGRLGVPTGVAG